MKRVILLALLAVASGIAGFLLYGGLAGQRGAAPDGLPSPTAGPQMSGPQVAERAPTFELPDLAGIARASSEWDGTIRMVNFWATWCPPCIREIPLLVDIQAEYGARGVQVLGIAIDETEEVVRFAQSLEFNYPVLIGQQDAMDLAHSFVRNFIGLPFTVFTDRNGRIVKVHTGEIHREQIEAILATLL